MNDSTNNLKIFTICLPREVERRQFLDDNFAALGVESNFVGIDGSQLPQEFSNRYKEEDAIAFWGRPLTRGEIGCYASHLSIWQQIAEGSDDMALVLESDAVLTGEALRVIELIRNSQANADMVMLSWGDCVPSFWEKRSLDANYSLVRFSRKSFFASAYLLSRRGAKELIRHSQAILLPVDELMLGAVIRKNMEIWAVYPRLINLVDCAYETSTLNNERKLLAGARGQADKQKQTGLKLVEQKIRHIILRLRKPANV